ncbi:MAG: hypothetical protein IPO48_18010 [Saprospiraceae bacterium]|nr:hypothetical protein [Saprospiraceae bacterium]
MRKKIIVIGLGNFGGNLAIALTQDGHEVLEWTKIHQKWKRFKERYHMSSVLTQVMNQQ